MLNLVGTKDLAALLKLQQKTVTDKLTKRPGFPAPAVDGSQKNRLWVLDDVLAYLKSGRRPARGSRGNSPSTVGGHDAPTRG